jgi:hypothetical protein
LSSQTAACRTEGEELVIRIGEIPTAADRHKDSSFDTVVIRLALCSIPDTTPCTRHIACYGGAVACCSWSTCLSPKSWVWAGQWLLDHLAVRLEGDHLIREPLVHVRSAGFEVEALERLKFGIVERLAARKPASGRYIASQSSGPTDPAGGRHRQRRTPRREVQGRRSSGPRALTSKEIRSTTDAHVKA